MPKWGKVEGQKGAGEQQEEEDLLTREGAKVLPTFGSRLTSYPLFSHFPQQPFIGVVGKVAYTEGAGKKGTPQGLSVQWRGAVCVKLQTFLYHTRKPDPAPRRYA